MKIAISHQFVNVTLFTIFSPFLLLLLLFFPLRSVLLPWELWLDPWSNIQTTVIYYPSSLELQRGLTISSNNKVGLRRTVPQAPFPRLRSISLLPAPLSFSNYGRRRSAQHRGSGQFEHSGWGRTVVPRLVYLYMKLAHRTPLWLTFEWICDVRWKKPPKKKLRASGTKGRQSGPMPK